MIKFQGIPTFDAPDGIFRAWYFEPFVAASSFFFWIQLYWRSERRQGASHPNSLNEAVEKPKGSSFQSLFASLIWMGESLQSGFAYLIGVYIWKMFIPPAAPHIPDGVPLPGVLYLLMEVVSGIVCYDFLFFLIHWGMHEIPFLRKIHHVHHERHARRPGTVEAFDVLHHSLADGSLQVLVNILVQRHTLWGTAKSRLARVLHNIIVTWMLTESHSSSPDLKFWRRWLVGVREHRLHHLYDNSGRSMWLSSSSESTSSSTKFDRHQQFFGYLADLRFFYREWKLRARVPSKKTT
jgi:sterol desaturase/sphingolipid hydroxylase (fatty acid hydroxylase superfamily)